MKRFFAFGCSCLLAILSLWCVSCNTFSMQKNDSYIEEETTQNTIYLDDESINVNGNKIQFSCYESYLSLSSENRSLSITITFTNTEKNEKSLLITSYELYNEDLDIVYDAETFSTKTMVLKYGIDNSVTFTGTIPTSYEQNKYALRFVADTEYVVCLYERPDELREDISINFYVNTALVKVISVKKGRTLAEWYTWENIDHLTYCEEWYIGSYKGDKLTQKTKIKEDLSVYGYECSNLVSTRDSSGVFITKINYVPRDGILVVPESGTDKLYISNFALKNNTVLQEIYLPKNLKKIYFGNFEKLPNLKKIHFAGTEEEWKNIPTSSEIPENVVIVYNSRYY